MEFRKKVMEENDDTEDDLAAVQRNIETAAGKVAHHTKAVRPTMYLASSDIKTAFDEAKPKLVAQILDSHETHGWFITALLREMSGFGRPGHV